MNSAVRALKRAVYMGILAVSLSGCEFVLFDPKGPIADTQMDLIVITTLIMLVVVVPVTIMGVWFPIRYRSNNTRQEYKPDWEHSNLIEAVVWSIPILIIIVLGTITYFTSYSLDPRKPLESDKPTMVVQVVAMDWKWLFIYPEYEIATVNEMAIPVDVPVEYLVTSDTVMNSFFVPHLGSQIYAMSGMENRVHLVADEEGVYPGFSANYSGFGFSGMKFSAIAKSEVEFDQWVARVKRSANPLDDAALAKLRIKSKDVEPVYFSSVNPLLFSNIIEKFTGAFNGQ
ncbi:MAG: ubiquinol oxidase subunit II [Pseudomonadota bacterium]